MLWVRYIDKEINDLNGYVPDYRAGAPDGVYDVYFPYIDCIGKGIGVIVQDGKFVLGPTIAAIIDARDMVQYWGDYIEDMMWDDDQSAFIVTIGS